MEKSEKDQIAVKSYQRPPPAGTAFVDNQGNSATCVRFAIAKAIANLLFVKKFICIYYIVCCTVNNFFTVLCFISAEFPKSNNNTRSYTHKYRNQFNYCYFRNFIYKK